MKSLKPLFLVLAGVLITVALFSFKNEEPKKEYSKLMYSTDLKNYIIIYDDFKEEIIPIKQTKGIDYHKEQISIINGMAKQGWIYKENVSGSFYFERTKQ